MSHLIVRPPRPHFAVGFTAASLALAAALAVPSDTAAQEATTTGSIAGRVLDADGTPLENVRVIATSLERGSVKEDLTDANGRFILALLLPGQYSVRAEFPPRPVAEISPVTVSIGQRAAIELTIQPVQLEALAVEVEGGLLDVAQGGVISQVTERQISELPSRGRDFTDFIALDGLVSPQPEVGTGGQFSIAGARSSGTNVQIDGADANNAFFGENQGGSRMPFTFSLESIKEFQVITNGYDVEHGRYSGGLINAVTKTGSNEFGGSGFFFWRDEALTTNNFDDSPPADFRNFQFGLNLSGPIVKDKLHYVFTADIQLQNQPVFALDPAVTNIPADDIAEFREILETVYDIPTEGDFGVFTETDDEIALFGRLDWSINNDNLLTFRTQFTDFENVNDRISPGGDQARTLGGTFGSDILSILTELNSSFSDEVFNTLRLQYLQQGRPRPGNSVLPTARVTVFDDDGNFDRIEYGGSFFGILFTNNLDENKFQFTDNVSWQRGDHTLKFGTNNIFTHTENLFWLNGNGFFDFRSLDDFRNANPSFFLRFVPLTPGGAPEPPFAEFNVQDYSFYAQDSWQASNRWLLNFGLRYDYTNYPDAGLPLIIPELNNALENEFGVATTTVPSDGNNWAPRFSFTFDPKADASSIVRGGVGWFYAPIPTVLHSNVIAKVPFPLLSTACFGSRMPEFDYGNWVDNPGAIPDRCLGSEGPSGQPLVTVWDPDIQNPRTIKTNIGYDQQISPRYRAGAQVIYSVTRHNYSVQDINLQEAQFSLADDRPVHVAEEDYDPTDEASTFDRSIDPRFDNIFFQTSEALARAWNFKLEVSGNPTNTLQFGFNYVLNLANDNSTFSCCLETEYFNDTPTFGDPNFIGDFGDDELGSWGPSAFQRRNVLVANVLWDLPGGFFASLFYRGQEGNPYTPFVDGDINADGNDENDRPFLPNPASPTGIQFETSEDLDKYRAIVAENDCLANQIGRIAGRNICRNPWWHLMNLRIEWSIPTVRTQQLSLIFDIFNLLDAFDSRDENGNKTGPGRFVFKQSELFQAEGYDPDTNEVIYSVNSRFGDEIPSGFEPFQFSAQIGIRYAF